MDADVTNRFFFVAPMYNAGRTLARMLHSVAGQSYRHWHVELIDDCSDADQQVYCMRDVIRPFQDLLQPGQSIDVTWNSDARGKQWEVSNVLYGISKAKDEDIICRIDADDYLCDLDALRVIDHVYRSNPDLDCLWTAHRWVDQNTVSSMNISAPLPENVDPYKHPWVSSHLKTFRKSVFNGINDINFRDQNGQYIKRAGDQAIYLPCLYRARKRGYLPFVTYAYCCDMSPDTFQTNDAKFQKEEAEFLRTRGFIE